MPRPRITRRRRPGTSVAAALAAVLITLALVVPHSATAQTTMDSGLSSTLTVNWATWLPALVSEFDPASSDDCIAGRDACIKKTLAEMRNQLDTLATDCHHNAVFSLAYTRITQGYEWIRSTVDADGSPHYANKAAMNFIVETFARSYLFAFQEWSAATELAPVAWQIAFDAAANKRVTGTGNLMLGINAHINRDLAFVMAATGLVNADGTSRKPDYDKVNELLLLLTRPLAAELSARFDPSMSDGEGSLADPATFSLIVSWRERAWRNAESLLASKTEEEFELNALRIEENATAEAALLLLSTAYVPLLSSPKQRDSHCAVHNVDPPPKPYPFKAK